MNRLKSLRNDKNLLQKDIAKLLKMSQNGYSQYETERNDISTYLLKFFSNYYDVSIDYILGITDTREKYKPSKIIKTNNNMNRLKDIRDDLDLNRSEVAKILGMSQTGYSAYETGFCDIPNKVLKTLANHYRVSADYILYVTDERKTH